MKSQGGALLWGCAGPVRGGTAVGETVLRLGATLCPPQPLGRSRLSRSIRPAFLSGLSSPSRGPSLPSAIMLGLWHIFDGCLFSPRNSLVGSGRLSM